uniref:Uncharacterized protein n=2 Tax=Phlebotomus papatasi TaxID=29031 RepID=A0A1B0D8U5_PHLPP
MISTKTSTVDLRSKALAKFVPQRLMQENPGKKYIRLSRTRTKTYLNFTDKSLSKIKLL